jgi:hypothetical protein
LDTQLLRCLQVLAIKAVEDPSYEEYRARIQRWYARNFHVSLSEVTDLSDEDLFKIYLEETYLAMYESEDDKEVQKYNQIRQAILAEFEDPQHQVQIVEEDDDWARQENEKEQEKWLKELNKIKPDDKAVAATTPPSPKPEEPQQSPNLTLEDSGFVTGEDQIPED